MNLAANAHFGDYWPPDFGWGGANDPEAHPEQLVPLVFDGVSFGQCHAAAHDLFVAFLTELVPHIEGGLHAGSCWSYSTTDNLPDGTRSFHSFGTAIDVNWNVNHMGTNIPDATGEWAIPRPIASRLAPLYGLEWGGDWSGGYHDNMHFEVHLSPQAARSAGAAALAYDELMEEIMAYYQSRADFEAALARIVHDNALPNVNKDQNGFRRTLAYWFSGVPGYKQPPPLPVKPSPGTGAKP